MTYKYGTSFFIFYTPLQMRDCKIDENLEDPNHLPRFAAETRSNNSGRYTLLKSHIPYLSLVYLT